jgi:hypothetical protein
MSKLEFSPRLRRKLNCLAVAGWPFFVPLLKFINETVSGLTAVKKKKKRGKGGKAGEEKKHIQDALNDPTTGLLTHFKKLRNSLVGHLEHIETQCKNTEEEETGIKKFFKSVFAESEIELLRGDMLKEIYDEITGDIVKDQIVSKGRLKTLVGKVSKAIQELSI